MTGFIPRKPLALCRSLRLVRHRFAPGYCALSDLCRQDDSSASGVATRDGDIWKLFACYLGPARIRKPRTNAGRHHWIWRHERNKSPISVSGTMRTGKSMTNEDELHRSLAFARGTSRSCTARPLLCVVQILVRR